MIKAAVSVLLVLSVCGFTADVTAAPRSVEQQAAQCRKDPRYRVGGAAIGDCLLEASEAVDREIAAAFAFGERRYCFDEDKTDFQRAQTEWQAYRDRLCKLVERSPDNTPSYVNGAACRLELGIQRLATMAYTNRYGNPRCPLDAESLGR